MHSSSFHGNKNEYQMRLIAINSFERVRIICTTTTNTTSKSCFCPLLSICSLSSSFFPSIRIRYRSHGRSYYEARCALRIPYFIIFKRTQKRNNRDWLLKFKANKKNIRVGRDLYMPTFARVDA